MFLESAPYSIELARFADGIVVLDVYNTKAFEWSFLKMNIV